MLSEKIEVNFLAERAGARDSRSLLLFQTCDDGRGLASHLVLVHILTVIQFTLHKNPGPE